MRVLTNTKPRPDYKAINTQQGLVYDFTGDGDDPEDPGYWVEHSYVELTEADMLALEEASRVVFKMFDEAGDWLAEHPEMLIRMGIPTWAHRAVIESWWRCAYPRARDEEHKEYYGSVFGRFDFAYGGADNRDERLRTPKLLEFNADTPTTLPEAALVQWTWHQSCKQGDDQWNMIWEMLVEAWKRNLKHITRHLGRKPIVYFACSNNEPSGEDEMNTIVMENICKEAGYETRRIYIEDVGLGSDGRFYDFSRPALASVGIDLGEADSPLDVDVNLLHHLDVVFKLYPWEFMLGEEFGQAAFQDMERLQDANGNYAGGTFWIEPTYKLLWSNKAILAVLWHLFGDDPERSKYLLPAYFAGEQPETMEDYVLKPLLGREGAGIQVVEGGRNTISMGEKYTESGFIAQQLHWLPAFAVGPEERLVYFMAGVWMADGEPAGLCFRGAGRITDNAAQFFPHVVNYPKEGEAA